MRCSGSLFGRLIRLCWGGPFERYGSNISVVFLCFHKSIRSAERFDESCRRLATKKKKERKLFFSLALNNAILFIMSNERWWLTASGQWCNLVEIVAQLIFFLCSNLYCHGIIIMIIIGVDVMSRDSSGSSRPPCWSRKRLNILFPPLTMLSFLIIIFFSKPKKKTKQNMYIFLKIVLPTHTAAGNYPLFS